jgi:hypothetical protein
LTPTIILLASAQSFPPVQGPGQAGPRGRNPFGQADADPLYAERRLNALNSDRHKSMVSDTEKLLRLAHELDAEIAANTTEGLTPKEIKDVAEIEKLARNVKEKMSRSYADGPIFYKEPPTSLTQ